VAKKVLLLGLLVIFIFSLSGCAMFRKNNDLEVQGLKNQISALETQLRVKDDEMDVLKESLTRASDEQKEVATKVSEVKERPNIKQIQLALKNAGYYQGAIDGKMGKVSRQAIKDFQKANNLSADGKVGKKTWEALKGYLEKKVK